MGDWAACHCDVEARRRALLEAYVLAVMLRVATAVRREVRGAGVVNGGRVTDQNIFGAHQFGFGYDNNGNATQVGSAQAAGYAEPSSYSPVDLVQSFHLPAGASSLSYSPDREGAGGTSPWGDLSFDEKGRLTAGGDVTYTYDSDDYLTSITSACSRRCAKSEKIHQLLWCSRTSW